MVKSAEEILRSQIFHIGPDERRRIVLAHLEPHPHKPDPAEVRLRENAVPVWSIIGYLPAVDYDIEAAARDYCLSVEAAVAAALYYLDNKDLIEWRLRQNRDEPVRLD